MTNKSSPIMYVNGLFVSEAEAHISPLDRGFTLADGLFETMVAKGNRVFRIEEHLRRLSHGAEVLQIQLPPQDEIAGVISETLRHNKLEFSVVRLTVTRGIDQGRGLDVASGLTPSMVVRNSLWSGPIDGLPQSRQLAFSSICRNNLSPLSGIKSLSYVDGVVARLEARRAGADDALLCNTNGHLTGATSSNVFIVRSERLLTPCKDDGILPGVARLTVLEEAGKLNIRVCEQSLKANQVEEADEVFLTNVVTGPVPVVSVSGNRVGSGESGPATEKIAEAYWNRVREELTS